MSGRSWVHGSALVAAVALAVGVVGPAAAAEGRHPRAAPSAPARTDLVFLRPLLSATAPRSAPAVADAQSSVVGTARSIGARVLARTMVPDALVVRATPAQARTLATLPQVARVLPNTLIPGPTVPSALPATGVKAGTPAHAPCGTPRKPELDPEALRIVNARGPDSSAYDGAGVTVAILADGINPANPDLRRNPAFASVGSPAGSRVITKYVDFSGEGTSGPTDGEEAFGDASSIAAQGNDVYDLSRYVGHAHPLHGGCDIRIEGDAPGASILAESIFGFGNEAYASQAIQAVSYAVAHGAKVLNESFGFENFPATSADALEAANDAAVAAGVTVVVSSGDAGITNTISSPAADPAVLAVGATTAFRAYAQLTYGGINALSSRAGFIDNNISALSSGGVAASGKTVSLVAPGDLDWALCSRGGTTLGCEYPIELFGGTSESSPLTAGAAADVIQAYESTHAGQAPTPALVEEVLTSSARDVRAPASQQGAGMLDVGAAEQLAASAPGTTASAPAGGILSDTTQALLSGPAGTTQSATVALTNTGPATVQVHLSTRALVPFRHAGGAVQISPRHKGEYFYDDGGFRTPETRKTMEVTKGTARLQVDVGTRSSALFSPLQVSLFAPDGDLAAYSLPQGFGSYADVEVADPAPGRWTAAVYSQGASSGDGVWSATSWRFEPVGSLSTSELSLAPGATGDVMVDETLPATPGDAALALVVATPTHVATVPIVERSDVVLGPQGARFSGVVTGGNGRFGAPGQTNTYAFTVPPGERDLDVGLVLAANRPDGQAVAGVLVDPAGDVQAESSNLDGDGAASRSLDLYAASPAAGQWELELLWEQAYVTTHTAVRFECSVTVDAVSATTALPDSPTTPVPTAGATYAISIHNTGLAPMFVSPDARVGTETTVEVPGLIGSPTRTLSNAIGFYELPTQVTSVEFATLSTVPATLQAQPDGGTPLLTPTAGMAFTTGSVTKDSATLHYTPPGAVQPGPWEFAAAAFGPYPKGGEPKGYVTMAVHATMPGFDPTVTSTVPDVVAELLSHPRSSPKPLEIKPGATGTLRVTITPTAAAGTVEGGTLYLTEYDVLGGPRGGVQGQVGTLAALPYEYVVS